jgi:folate-binding protein YgfZ
MQGAALRPLHKPSQQNCFEFDGLDTAHSPHALAHISGAVAFDKGCYIGQELTARTKFRGEVRLSCFIRTFYESRCCIAAPGLPVYSLCRSENDCFLLNGKVCALS